MHKADDFPRVWRIDDVVADIESSAYAGREGLFVTKDDCQKIVRVFQSGLVEYRLLYFVTETDMLSSPGVERTRKRLHGPYAIPPLNAQHVDTHFLKQADFPLRLIPVEERKYVFRTDAENTDRDWITWRGLYECAHGATCKNLASLLPVSGSSNVPYRLLRGATADGVVCFSYHSSGNIGTASDLLILHVFGRDNFCDKVCAVVNPEQWASLQQRPRSELGVSSTIHEGLATRFPHPTMDDLDHLKDMPWLILPE
ncbi:hypothetical protein HY490_00605 [Candidatus Woesearchaeota archaeon]|nr:hypothetical protein [Candidatus Woesearchaeota archaeon]